MSQNVYVNLKSLKTSVSGDGRTAFDKLKTVFGKNSSNGDNPMQASRPGSIFIKNGYAASRGAGLP